MRTVAVTAPDGTEWAVRVAWQPRWPLLVRRVGGWRAKRRTKKVGRSGEMVDVVDPVGLWGDAVRVEGDLGDFFVAILVIIGMIVFGLLFWFLLLPLLLLVFDVVVLLFLF